jgi:hypothetical protein
MVFQADKGIMTTVRQREKLPGNRLVSCQRALSGPEVPSLRVIQRVLQMRVALSFDIEQTQDFVDRERTSLRVILSGRDGLGCKCDNCQHGPQRPSPIQTDGLPCRI